MNRKTTALFLVSVVSVALVASLFYEFASVPARINVGNFQYGGSKEGEKVEISGSAYPSSVSAPGITYGGERYSLPTGVEKVMQAWRRVLMLPTWLPGNLTYADVYIGSTVIIAYSDRRLPDWRFTSVSMELVLDPNPPSLDELREVIGNDTTTRLVEVGDLGWVVIGEKRYSGWIEEEALGPRALTLSTFWKDGIAYHIGVLNPLTPEDLLKVLESMKPVA